MSQRSFFKGASNRYEEIATSCTQLRKRIGLWTPCGGEGCLSVRQLNASPLKRGRRDMLRMLCALDLTETHSIMFRFGFMSSLFPIPVYSSHGWTPELWIFRSIAWANETQLLKGTVLRTVCHWFTGIPSIAGGEPAFSLWPRSSAGWGSTASQHHSLRCYIFPVRFAHATRSHRSQAE